MYLAQSLSCDEQHPCSNPDWLNDTRKREIVHYKIVSGLARCVGHKHEKTNDDDTLLLHEECDVVV